LDAAGFGAGTIWSLTAFSLLKASEGVKGEEW
jgi:hypothetical protein